MKPFVRTALSVCFCLFMGLQPVQAQEWWTGDNGSGSGDSSSNTTTNNDGGVNTGSPEWSQGYTNNNGSPAYTEPYSDDDYIEIEDTLNRQAEEAVYESRGVTMDFLNKPIELFKLTCTDSSTGDKDKLGATFGFATDMWKQFCKDQVASGGKINVGDAAKCALDEFLKAQFKQVIKSIDKFKNIKFCDAFTKFVSNQLDQCVTLRFDLPRGQFPGFPALNQCMFGRLNLTLDGNQLVNAQGQKVNDVVSRHGFKYATVNPFSPTGFGGSEQQLLGNDGASALMKVTNWQQSAQSVLAPTSCQNMDQDLIKIFNEYPADTLTLVPSPSIDARRINGFKYDSQGNKNKRNIAIWESRFNAGSNSFDAYLTPGADGGWAAKGGANYLASCYGFTLNVENTTCNWPPSDSYQIMCKAAEQSKNCCDPKKTDCVAGDLKYAEDICKTEITNGDGSKTCTEWSHRSGDIKFCEMEGLCCNPAMNNCLAIGVDICPEFVPPKQCLTATPAQLAALDPAYSKLAQGGVRPAANQMIDGRVCCTTEWCNLCPQDVINAGAGRGPGGIVYMKTSEMANIPAHCKGQRTAGDSTERNTFLPTLLMEIPDQVFANTEEACEMKAQGTDPGRIFDLLVRCPSKNSREDEFTLPGSMAVEKIIKWVVKSTDNCPNNGELKPYNRQVVESIAGCSVLADTTKYPMPMEKIPKVEGADDVGLCSSLPLCPASIPGEQDPFQNSGVLDDLKGAVGEGIRGILNRANGTRDPVPGSTRYGNPNNVRSYTSPGRTTGPRVVSGSTTTPSRTTTTETPSTRGTTTTTTTPTTTPRDAPRTAADPVTGNPEATKEGERSSSRSESWF